MEAKTGLWGQSSRIWPLKSRLASKTVAKMTNYLFKIIFSLKEVMKAFMFQTI